MDLKKIQNEHLVLQTFCTIYIERLLNKILFALLMEENDALY